jgi:hypothetical protein
MPISLPRTGGTSDGKAKSCAENLLNTLQSLKANPRTTWTPVWNLDLLHTHTQGNLNRNSIGKIAFCRPCGWETGGDARKKWLPH